MPLKRRYRTNRISTKRKKRGFPLIRLTCGVIFCIACVKLIIERPPTKSATIQNATVLPDVNLYKAEGQKLLHYVMEQEQKPVIHVVKPGESFYSIFSLLKIDQLETALILQSFKQLDLTKLFPGDSLVIKKNSDSSFSSIDFFNSLHNKYTIQNNDSCIHAKLEDLPLTNQTYVLNGFLETSLSEAMYSLGVSDIITANVADIFAWDINFFIDPRKGDTFQVIFEKKIINGRFCGYGNIVAAKYTLGNQKSYYAFGLSDKDGKIRYYDIQGKAVQKQFLKAPLQYSRVSSGFSYHRKHPILGIVRPHLGVDYAAPYGTPVHAAADGKIVFAGNKADYGRLIIITHGGAYQTYYGHLQTFARNIHNGEYVRQGDVIGNVGATGLATGPHLDYRMQKGGCYVNPMTISSPSVLGVSEEQRNEFVAFKEKCLYLFEKRFNPHPGCYLFDISKPVYIQPKIIILKKPHIVVKSIG